MRNLLPRLTLMAWFVACLAAMAHAQVTAVPACDAWERIQTPTHSDLWGISTDFDAHEITNSLGGIQYTYYSSPKYIAVGTQGTIITSQNGNSWVIRSSGTTEWLLGVTFRKTADSKIWVVVGDKGTILTSTDGIKWSPQVSGTSTRLNGIAANGTAFLAVGENGTLCFSTDGVQWAVTSTGTPEWLRGVVYSDDKKGFIVSGANGRIFLTSDGKTITPFHSGGARDVAAQALPGNFFAGDRTIWHLEGDGSLTKILDANSFFRGITNSFSNLSYMEPKYTAVGTQGVLALSPRAGLKEWLLLQLPTADNLLASHSDIACGEGGVVWLQHDSRFMPPLMDVSNGSNIPGTLYEGGNLLIDPGVPSPNGLSFRWYKNGKVIEGATQPALPLVGLQNSDLGTYSCAITNADHFYLWHIQLPTILPAPPSIVQIEALGTVPRSDSPLVSQLFSPSKKLSVFPDATEQQNVPSNLRLQLVGKTLLVSRSTPTGEIDPSFIPESISLAIPDKAVPAAPQIWTHTDASGKVWVAITDVGKQTYPVSTVYESAYNYDTGFTILLRLLPSYRNDTSFSQITLGNNSAIYFRHPYIYVSDRSAFQPTVPMIIVRSSEMFRRYDMSGLLDPTYHPDLLGNFVACKTMLQDGTLIVLTPVRNELGLITSRVQSIEDAVPIFYPMPNSPSPYDPNGIVYDPIYRMKRISPDGSIDPDFRADLEVSGYVHSMSSLSDGSIRLKGVFVSINGVQCVATQDLSKLKTYQNTLESTARIVPDRHASTTRLIGLSSRAVVGPDSETLITGFMVTGATHRSIVTSGIGPGLASHGVSSPLTSPIVTLYAGQVPRMSNDNWEKVPDQKTFRALRAKTGAFPLVSGIADASAYGDIAPGAYSVLVTSKTAQNGVALAEVYDASDAPSSYADGRVTGFSTRGKVGKGEDVMIAGFAIDGPNTKRVLICGSGPALTKFGVSGAIPSVKLSLYHEGHLLTVAYPGIQKNLMQVINYVLGVDHLPSDSKDTAMCVTLLPGAYSIVMSGETDADAGVGLIEVFEAP